MGFSVIAAVDEALGIGKDGKLPWSLKGDMERFRTVTVGNGKNAVVMGRSTWDSLPEKYRPLKQRVNVVLTRQAGLVLPPGVETAHSLEEALQLLSKRELEEVFVIGGGSVYAEAVQHPSCRRLYLTEVAGTFECDTYFPQIPESFVRKEESAPITEGQVTYCFVTYEKV